MQLAETVINRQGALQQDRQKYDKVWKETAGRMAPFGLILEGKRGDMSKIFSSRPLQDLSRFAADIESLLIPRGSVWPVEDELKEDDEVQAWQRGEGKEALPGSLYG